jgi:HD-like signal output (HDOD) protein
MDNNITLERLVSNPLLPSLPEAVVRLNELIASDAPINDIAAVITHEPSLTVRTLELANSAWYKRQNQITTVASAIAVIGVNTLYQLIFASSVTRIFSGIDSDLVNMHSFWRQSVRMAIYAEMLASLGKSSTPTQLFTCGLLTYIGKLVIYITVPESATRILELTQNRASPQYQVEQQILGFAHGDVSAALLNKWNIPASIHIPIQHYTNPEMAPGKYRADTCVLNLAHHMQFTYGDTLGITDPPGPVNQYALNALQLAEMELSRLSADAQQLFDKALSLLGL